MLTDERIVDLRRTTGPASGYTQWADTIGFSRAVEAEVRKEQADKIAELTRQLEAVRKDSDLVKDLINLVEQMFASTYPYREDGSCTFNDSVIRAWEAIKAKEKP